MTLTKEQIKEFEEAAKPLMKFLSENCNPHTHVVVESGNAVLAVSSVSFVSKEFIQD